MSLVSEDKNIGKHLELNKEVRDRSIFSLNKPKHDKLLLFADLCVFTCSYFLPIFTCFEPKILENEMNNFRFATRKNR